MFVTAIVCAWILVGNLGFFIFRHTTKVSNSILLDLFFFAFLAAGPIGLVGAVLVAILDRILV